MENHSYIIYRISPWYLLAPVGLVFSVKSMQFLLKMLIVKDIGNVYYKGILTHSMCSRCGITACPSMQKQNTLQDTLIKTLIDIFDIPRFATTISFLHSIEVYICPLQ